MFSATTGSTTIKIGLAALLVLAATGCTLQLGLGEPQEEAAAGHGDDSAEETPAADQPPRGEGGGGSGGGGGGGAGKGDNAGAKDGPPEVVSIRLIDATVRPWDGSQECWDSNDVVSAESVQALAVALGASDPYAAVAAFIAGLLIEHYAPPDPYGWAQIFVDNAWQPELDLWLASWENNYENTVTPSWGPPYSGWDHVPLQENVRIRLSLVDEDELNEDDPIGAVELDYDDLLAAVDSGEVYEVPVWGQGQGAILFFGISVVAEQ
ncbi:MAG: hypothetical protein HY744_23355 [Deltaproteobacteria bacterium]|nr:hypothetical protein [Deltaproteobacteria bacterium]